MADAVTLRRAVWPGISRHGPIGLDVGAAGVRAVQLECSRTRRRVGHVMALARNAEAEVANKPVTLNGAEVQPYLAGSGFRGRQVVMGLNSPDIEFVALEIPEALVEQGGAEAAEAARWEIARLTSFRGATLEHRFWILPASTHFSTNAIGVAARREQIDALVEECDRAHFCCTCIDAGATALVRFAAQLRPWPDRVVWGLLDLGARQTRLVLCVGECPVLIRAAGVGGNRLTQRIVDALSVSFETAEIHKRDVGIAQGDRRGRRSRCGAATSRSEGEGDALLSPTPVSAAAELGGVLLGAMRGDLNDIAAEVKRSYEYVLGCYPECTAGDLVLAGGGANMRGLGPFLEDLLGIPVAAASNYVRGSASRLDPTGLHDDQINVLAQVIGLGIE